MALKYYKSIECDGIINTLKIYDEEYNGASMEIGAIQDLQLELMGGQNEVDSPVVKTAISFTLVDAPDEIAAGKYYGDWSEFYTASPTKYKVTLESNGVLRWSGYVTPHSYEEDLVYRGSITITARDNIGRLKDIVWDETGDANGMVSIMTILNKAWEKAQIAMPLVIDPEDNWAFCNSNPVYDNMIVADFFANKTWGDVVEAVLRSSGMVLRYCDNNIIKAEPLRSICNVSASQDAVFTGGAHRSIEPCVKGVVIEQGYDIAQGIVQKEADRIRYQADVAYTYRYWNLFGEEKEAQGVVNPLAVSNEVGAWQNATDGLTLFFNTYDRVRRESMQKKLPEDGVMYLAANVVQDRFVFADKKIADDFVWRLQFGVPIQFYRSFDNLDAKPGLGLRKVKLQVISNPSTASQQYYNGSSWQNNECYIEEEYNVSDYINEVAIPVEVSSEMVVRMAIIYIEYRQADELTIMNDLGGYYASLLSMSYDIPDDNNSIPSGRRIELEGNAEGNRLLEESIELGAMKAQQLMPKIVVNGMYMPETYRPADAWSFVGQTATYPLMLLIAMQKAAIYGRPCDMITGEVIVEGGVRFDSLITYNGKKYLVLGGTWNVINGRIEGVCLREVVRYEDYWIEGKEVRYSVSIPASSSGGKGGYVGGSGGSGSASGGVRELSALSDVELSAPADNDILAYASGKWKNVSKVDYLADLSARIAKFEDWFVLENGYIKATRGFFSDGTMGARTVGSTGGGGGGLIAYVYGYDAIEGTYYDTDKNNTFNAYTIAKLHSRLKGVEDAGYITSSALNGYAKTTDLANYATTSALTSGLANKQDTITSSNKLPYSYLSGVPDLSLYALNSTLASVAFNGSYADLDGTPQSLKNPYALTFGSKTYDGSSAKTITASDLGALTSHQAIYGLTIKRNGTLLGVYTPNSASKEIDIAVPTKMSELTDDVVSGKYLPLSGGVLTGNIAWQRNVNGNDIADWNAEASKFGIGIISAGGASTGVPTGYATALNVRGRYGFQLASEGGNYDNFFIRNASTIRPWVKLIHSGNIASQNVNSALMLDGKSLKRFIYNELGESETGTTDTGEGGYESLTRTQFFRDNTIFSIGLLVYHSSASTYGFALYNYSYETANLKFRLKSAGAWGIEKTIAFTDSNVASATKLQTARTIWGQSFDGTGKVDGKIYQDGKWILGRHSDGNLYIGFDTYSTNDTLIYGRSLYFGTSARHSMLINSSGNVTIGASDLATITYKLYVDGSLYAVNQADLTNLDIRNISNAKYIASIRMNTNGVYLQSRHEGVGYLNTILNHRGGNVGIGITDPQYKLDVNGSAHFNGLITADSGIKIGDATITWDASANALKIDKSVYSLGGFGTK